MLCRSYDYYSARRVTSDGQPLRIFRILVGFRSLLISTETSQPESADAHRSARIPEEYIRCAFLFVGSFFKP